MRNSTAIVINSVKETVRRKHMDKMLSHFGIDYIIQPATHVDDLSSEILAQFGSPSEPSALRSIACTASHISVWKAFLSSDYESCVVLEDDIRFYYSFDLFWNEFDPPKDRFEIWKIEACDATCTIERKSEWLCDPFSFHQLHSGHACSGAYILNRKTARFLLSMSDEFRANVDHELFNPVLRTVPMCRVFQAVPAPCIQESAYARNPVFASTIGAGRNSDQESKLNQLRRKYLSPIVTMVVSCLIRYQGLRRIKVGHLPVLEMK